MHLAIKHSFWRSKVPYHWAKSVVGDFQCQRKSSADFAPFPDSKALTPPGLKLDLRLDHLRRMQACKVERAVVFVVQS
jgi:hypothetical protein